MSPRIIPTLAALADPRAAVAGRRAFTAVTNEPPDPPPTCPNCEKDLPAPPPLRCPDCGIELDPYRIHVPPRPSRPDPRRRDHDPDPRRRDPA